MILKPQVLAGHFRQNCLPMYWVSGDEPLLLQEAADQIRQCLRERQFSERQVFTVDRNFRWQRFTESSGNLSLFAERKLFELRLGSGTLDESGREALQHYLVAPDPDYVILILGPRLEAATLNTRWFKALDGQIGLVQVWPLAVADMPEWLERRLSLQGMRATPEAIQLLVDRSEGNLLAAAQEIEKLRLLSDGPDGQAGILDAATVLDSVADSARYNAYTLIDAALSGDAERTVRILTGLRAEGAEPLAIVGALNRELGKLAGLLERAAGGESMRTLINGGGIVFHRRDLVERALRRLESRQLYKQLERLHRIDLAVKGMAPFNPWDALAVQLLKLCGVNLPMDIASST